VNDIKRIIRRKKQDRGSRPGFVVRRMDGIIPPGRMIAEKDFDEEVRQPLLKKKLADLEIDLLRAYRDSVERGEVEEEKRSWSFRGVFVGSRLRTSVTAFAIVVLAIPVSVFGIQLWQKGSDYKNQLFASAFSAYGHLETAQAALGGSDVDYARAEFENASRNFGQISEQLGDVGGLLVGIGKVAPLGKISDGVKLLEAGRLVSEAGYELTNRGADFLEGRIGFDSIIAEEHEDDEVYESGAALFEALDSIVYASEKISQATDLVLDVDPDSFPSVAGQISSAKESLPKMESALRGIVDLKPLMEHLLGREGYRRYLIVFQNSAEKRPTGGFMGSFVLMDTNAGRIESFEVEDIYDPDGQLGFELKAPLAYHQTGLNIRLRDANVFADFPTSAEKVAWFYEQAGGETVDGVIFLTPAVVEGLLDIVGSIEIPEREITIDGENLVLEMDRQIEVVEREKGSDHPKGVMNEVYEVLLERMSQNGDRWPEVLGSLLGSLKRKDILMYFRTDEYEQMARDKDWAGEIKDIDGDYFGFVDVNLFGRKTDYFVSNTVDHNIVINGDGSVIEEVVVTRRFKDPGSLYEDFPFIGTQSRSMLKFFVPAGSELLGVEGFSKIDERRPPNKNTEVLLDNDIEKINDSLRIDQESMTQITEEHGKTVFGNWVVMEPGETRQMRIRYRLPFSVDPGLVSKDSYNLLVQSQPGADSTDYRLRVDVPDDWEVSWSSTVVGMSDEWLGTDYNDLVGDSMYSLSLKRNWKR